MKEFISKNPRHASPSEVWNGNREPHAEVPERMDAIEDALKSDGSNELLYPESFHEVPVSLLKGIHDPAYIDYLLTVQKQAGQTGDDEYRYPSVFPARRTARTPSHPNGELGFYSFDLYTPINSRAVDAAMVAASGAYSAALAVLDGDKTSYAIGRPPGHHAGFDYMGGYCYINNAAVAAKVLSDHGKVGILDVDFHHGNGTEDIFKVLQDGQISPHVLHISIHANPDRMFPYFSGDTTSPTEPLQNGINFALDAGITDSQYQEVLREAMERLASFKPDYLVIPVGFDTHEKDPIADFKLTTAYYEQMAGTIMEGQLPTVFVQEGGYNLDTIGPNIQSFIKGTR